MIEHWESQSVNPEISVNFDEPVTILDVVLRPKFSITAAPSDFMQIIAANSAQFLYAKAENFNFMNLFLSLAGRPIPVDMTESFKSIK